MMDNILSLLGLALKAGKVEVGEEPVGAAARAKKARVIFLAADAAAGTQRRARHFGEQGACLMLELPADKDTLGRALGRTSCAMCAVTDIGFAGAVVKKLAAMDETYADAAARLDLKARRAMERRKEQLRHEKNIRAGKKKVTKAPAAVPAEKTEMPRGGRNSGHKRYFSPKTKTPAVRFAGSRPVKKGKGSKTAGMPGGKTSN